MRHAKGTLEYREPILEQKDYKHYFQAGKNHKEKCGPMSGVVLS